MQAYNQYVCIFKIHNHEKDRYAVGYWVRNHICGAGDFGSNQGFCCITLKPAIVNIVIIKKRASWKPDNRVGIIKLNFTIMKKRIIILLIGVLIAVKSIAGNVILTQMAIPSGTQSQSGFSVCGSENHSFFVSYTFSSHSSCIPNRYRTTFKLYLNGVENEFQNSSRSNRIIYFGCTRCNIPFVNFSKWWQVQPQKKLVIFLFSKMLYLLTIQSRDRTLHPIYDDRRSRTFYLGPGAHYRISDAVYQ